MIQSLEFLRNRYYNLITYVDVNNTTEEILQILERLANLLNIEKAVENEITIQSTNIVLEENRETPRFCKSISYDLYTGYAFDYYKKIYFDPIIDKVKSEIKDIEAELEKLKGIKDPIAREKIQNRIRSKKVYLDAVIKAKNANNIKDVAFEFQSELLQQIKNDYDKNKGILPSYIKDFAIRELITLAYSTAFEFYPTPPSVIDLMLQKANIHDNQLILEPSAGKGDIIDKVVAYNQTVNVDFCEFNRYNSEILELKCYNKIGTDFLLVDTEKSVKYDRILMNPPFEDRADIEHIRRAFSLLKDDGILVSVITAKSISNSTPETSKMRKDAELWGEIVELDEDIMKTEAERKATVTIALVVLHRAKYLALLSQREKAVDVNDISINDYFLDTQSNLIWQVTDYTDSVITISNKINDGITKVYDLKKMALRTSLKLINSDEAIKLINKRRAELEDIKTDFETQCANINYEDFCASGEYVPLTGLITARPQFAKKPTSNKYDELNLNVETGFVVSETAIDGFNLSVESIDENGAFLLTDGTGAGKTVQQLMVAKYFVDKYKKPFLIVTKDDRIIEQAFRGDAVKIGMAEYIRPLPDLRYPEKIPNLLENGYIYICKYIDFNLVRTDGLTELSNWNKAKKDWTTKLKLYKQELRELAKAYPTKEDKKSKTYIAAAKEIRENIKNDNLQAVLFQAEEEWKDWNKKTFNAIGEKLSGIAFDECHELKNWDDYDFNTGFKAKRPMWVSEACESRLFVSATPCDRADAMLYLQQAGVWQSKKIFEKQLMLLGFTYTEERKNDFGKVIRRGRWVMPMKYDKPLAAQQMQNIYEDMTEDGKMIKREIPLTNYNIQIMSVNVPQNAKDTIEDIENYYAEPDTFDEDDETSKRKGSKATMYMDMLRSLEPYKIASTIKIVENEIKNCRSVVIFAALKEEGETGKEWGEVKAGTIRSLYEYFTSVYGKDKVGLVVGGMKYEDVVDNVREFQQNKKFIIIATAQAGGTGISLDDQTGTRARSIICLTAPLNAEGNVQMLGRIYRLNTKTCANAYYLFANDIFIETWLAELVANKMMMLNATVGGEVDKLNIGTLKTGDVDDSMDSLEASKVDINVDKDTEKRLSSHPLWKLWETKDWISGLDYPDKVNIRIKYGTPSYGRGSKVFIKSDSKANLLNWALPYQQTLADFNFKITSDRYEGTMYEVKFDLAASSSANKHFREVWSWLINIILPQISRSFANEETNIYNVGDELVLTQADALGGATGDKVEVISFRKRIATKFKISEKEYREIFEYLYDCKLLSGENAGVILRRLNTNALAFANNNELMSKLDPLTNIVGSLEEINDILKGNTFGSGQYTKHLKLDLSYSRNNLNVWLVVVGKTLGDNLFSVYFKEDKSFYYQDFNPYNDAERWAMPIITNFLNDYLNTNLTIENVINNNDSYQTYQKYIVKNNESSLPTVTIPANSGGANGGDGEENTNKSENVGVEVITQNEDTFIYTNPFTILKTKMGFSIIQKGKTWVREILSYNPNITSGFSFEGQFMPRDASANYSTTKLYLYAITVDGNNNYGLFTIDSNKGDITMIHTLKNSNAKDWAKEFWKYIDNYYKGTPLDVEDISFDPKQTPKNTDDKLNYDLDSIKKLYSNDNPIEIMKIQILDLAAVSNTSRISNGETVYSKLKDLPVDKRLSTLVNDKAFYTPYTLNMYMNELYNKLETEYGSNFRMIAGGFRVFFDDKELLTTRMPFNALNNSIYNVIESRNVIGQGLWYFFIKKILTNAPDKDDAIKFLKTYNLDIDIEYIYNSIEFQNLVNNTEPDYTLSDKIEDDKFKDNREKYDIFVKKTFGNDFKIGIDKDFVNVYNKNNQIVGQIVKYDGKIIKGQIDMFSDINSNNYLAELLELRNLLLLKTAIKNKKVEEYNTLFGLTETTDRNQIRNSIFDTLENYYNKVKTGTFEMNDLLSTIAPVIRI